MAEQAQPGTIVNQVFVTPPASARARRLAKTISNLSRDLLRELAELDEEVVQMAGSLEEHKATLARYGIQTKGEEG